MLRLPVSSSNVASVGYDPDTSTLEVEFHSGSVYQYFGVPSTVYSALISAPSVGGYLARSVKNVYRYAQI